MRVINTENNQPEDIGSENIIQSLSDIAREIEIMERAREARLQATHGRFNLFTTLLAGHDEVRLHTRYLTHLLNPEGTHDCGRQFLDLFLEKINIPDLKYQPCSLVQKEHYTGGSGNIDIYIEFEDATLVIENKINAPDGEDQLQRYSDYAKTRREKVHLFYLTLDGKSASPFSRGSISEEKYRRISYETDILEWIEDCLQSTYEFVNINQALQQYKMTINQLLGKTLEKEYMSKIKEHLMGNKDIMKNADQIMSALEEIKRDRDEKIQKTYCEILRCDATCRIDSWEGNPVFQFSSHRWGDRTDLTAITVLYSPDYASVSLRVDDEKSGKLWTAVENGGYKIDNWQPDSGIFTQWILKNATQEEAKKELKRFVKLIESE